LGEQEKTDGEASPRVILRIICVYKRGGKRLKPALKRSEDLFRVKAAGVFYVIEINVTWCVCSNGKQHKQLQKSGGKFFIITGNAAVFPFP